MYDLKVGFSCNNNCIHCVVGSKRDTRDLSFKEITDIIDRVPEGEGLQLTGGEISIRKDFYDILKYSHDHGHGNYIQSNGTGFDNEELTKKCAPYISQVLLAIHSCEEEVHNKIVNCVSSRSMFKRTIQGFDNLVKYGVPIMSQTVLSNLNIPTLYDTYAMIQKKCPGIMMHLTYPHPLGNAFVNKDVVCPKYSDIKKYLTPCLRDFGPYLLVEALPPCYIHPYYSNVEYHFDASIKRNEIQRRGYDKANTGTELFPDGETENYNLNDLDSKRKGQLCGKCFYDKECIGVWKEYMDFYKDELDLFPIEGLDKRSLEEYQIYIQEIPENEKLFPDLGTSRAVLKGNIADNMKYLLEKSEKYPFLLFDISCVDIKEIPCGKNVHLSITNKSQLTLLQSALDHRGYKWYIDIDISHFEPETILDLLDLLENHSDLKFVRLLPGFYREDQLAKKLDDIAYLAEYVYDYTFPITFVNIPKCLTDNCPETLQLHVVEYTICKTDRGERNLVEEIAQTEDCAGCKWADSCLGFIKGLISAKVNGY